MIMMNRISVQQTQADCCSCFKSGPKTDVTVRTGALNVDMMHGSADMMGIYPPIHQTRITVLIYRYI